MGVAYKKKIFQKRRSYARNVKLYYPYWQYTDLFIFRSVSPLCLRSTLRLLKKYTLICWYYIFICAKFGYCNSFTLCAFVILVHQFYAFKRCNLLSILQKLISNSWGKHKGNHYHDGDFIPSDKTYWIPMNIGFYIKLSS